MRISQAAEITLINLRHNFPMHLAAAVMISLLTPLVFSITALDRVSSARPLEMLMCMTGAVLMTPVFSPEQNENIRDVIRSKRVDHLWVCLMRTVYSAAALAAVMGIFVLVMKQRECDVTLAHFGAGFASAFFLGSVGLAFAKIGGTVAGYMASMIYYLLNFSGVLPESLRLFTMSGGRTDVNFPLMIWGVIIIAATFTLSAAKDRT